MHKTFCPHCGHLVNPHSEYCGNCGFNLKAYFNNNQRRVQPIMNTKPKQPQPARRVRKRKKHHGWLWLILIIIIAGGGYMGYQYVTHQSFSPVGSNKISFKVSTFPDSDIYLNGSKVGTADDSGNYKVHSVAPHESVTASYNGGDSESVDTNSDNDNTTVNVDYPDMIHYDTANHFIRDMFGNVASLVADGDDSDQNEDLADYYQDGSNNSSYRDLKNWAKAQHHNDHVDGIDFTEDVKSIKPASGNTCEVTYDIKYDFSLDNDKDHIQVFQWHAKMKKIDGHWYIVNAAANNTPLSDHMKSSDDDPESSDDD